MYTLAFSAEGGLRLHRQLLLGVNGLSPQGCLSISYHL